MSWKYTKGPYICKFCLEQFENKGKIANHVRYKHLKIPAWNKGLTKEVDIRVETYGKKGRGKHSNAGPKNYVFTVEHKRKLSLAQIGVSKPAVSRALKGRKQNPEVVKKRNASLTLCWAEGRFHRNYRYKHIRPNKAEITLEEILGEACPTEYKYNDGWLLLLNHIPDFVNINGQKKLIELYGDYWHRGDNPNEIIQLYISAGYNCLVIWEKELYDDKVALVSKLREFTYGR